MFSQNLNVQVQVIFVWKMSDVQPLFQALHTVYIARVTLSVAASLQ